LFKKFAGLIRQGIVMPYTWEDPAARVLEVRGTIIAVNFLGFAILAFYGEDEARRLVAQAHAEAEDYQHNDGPTMQKIFADLEVTAKAIQVLAKMSEGRTSKRIADIAEDPDFNPEEIK
jgi:hypothetical protein